MQVILNGREYEDFINDKCELIKLKRDLKSCFTFKKVEFNKEEFINNEPVIIDGADIDISKIAELIGLSEDEIKYLKLLDREDYLVKC